MSVWNDPEDPRDFGPDGPPPECKPTPEAEHCATCLFVRNNWRHRATSNSACHAFVLAPVTPIVPKVAGQSYVKNYSAEVFDLPALQRHVAAHTEDSNLTIANMSALDQRVRAGGGRIAIPGVRVIVKEIVRGRAAG